MSYKIEQKKNKFSDLIEFKLFFWDSEKWVIVFIGSIGDCKAYQYYHEEQGSIEIT